MAFAIILDPASCTVDRLWE